MPAKPSKILIPTYTENFKCIGGACEDSCCIGWDIDLDKKTFKKYRKSKDPKLKSLIRKNIYRNRMSYSRDVDYGRIAIRENSWCPFLDDDKLCQIHSTAGEDSLSNVCYTFPRNYNILNGVVELSLYLSCPEAVRKLFEIDEPLNFIEKVVTQERMIISNNINTADRYWKNSPIKRLDELRSRSIHIIQNRSFPLRDRVIKLGEELASVSRSEEIDIKVSEQVDFLLYTIESLGMVGEGDSPAFSEYTTLVLDEISHISMEDYGRHVNQIVKPFIDENSHMFENYLVNTVFQENFPFSMNEDAFDGYIMLVLRYALILFYLTASAVRNKKLTIENLVSLVQVHTKIINHHKSFSYNILQEIKRKDYDSMNFLSGIII